jgi:hypothetical protein
MWAILLDLRKFFLFLWKMKVVGVPCVFICLWPHSHHHESSSKATNLDDIQLSTPHSPWCSSGSFLVIALTQPGPRSAVHQTQGFPQLGFCFHYFLALCFIVFQWLLQSSSLLFFLEHKAQFLPQCICTSGSPAWKELGPDVLREDSLCSPNHSSKLVFSTNATLSTLTDIFPVSTFPHCGPSYLYLLLSPNMNTVLIYSA